MEHTEFGGYAGFRAVRFADMALFRWTVFGGEALFEQAPLRGRRRTSAGPGSTARPASTARG